MISRKNNRKIKNPYRIFWGFVILLWPLLIQEQLMASEYDNPVTKNFTKSDYKRR